MAGCKKTRSTTKIPYDPQWQVDYILVQRYLAGDIGAWDRLYRMAYPAAMRFLSQQPVMAYLEFKDMPDILSEAFLRCQSKADRFLGASSFRTYVCGFVRNVALNFANARAAEDRKVTALRYIYRTKNSAPSPETILLRRERDRCLWVAYRSLPPHHRYLIGYLVLEENSYWEARKATGLRYKEELEEALPYSLTVLKDRFLTLYNG